MTASSQCPPVSPAYAGLPGTWLEGWGALLTGMTECLTAGLRAGEQVVTEGGIFVQFMQNQ